jgi:DNA-binding transcriptional ArsR family regulator
MRVTATAALPASRVATALGVAPATASEHLRLLRRAGFAEVSVEGARRLYRAVPARLGEVSAALLARTAAPAAPLGADPSGPGPLHPPGPGSRPRPGRP